MKKYKLKIPLDMLMIVPRETREQQSENVFIEDDNSLTTVIIDENGNRHNVKRLWLEEIEDEPKTFDTYMSNKYGLAWRVSRYKSSDMVNAYLWTVQNERKRHHPKQTLDEMLSEYENKGISRTSAHSGFRSGYRACEKNRGYDE